MCTRNGLWTSDWSHKFCARWWVIQFSFSFVQTRIRCYKYIFCRFQQWWCHNIWSDIRMKYLLCICQLTFPRLLVYPDANAPWGAKYKSDNLFTIIHGMSFIADQKSGGPTACLTLGFMPSALSVPHTTVTKARQGVLYVCGLVNGGLSPR